MKIFFLGIGGTLMGNLAVLAREAGHEVRGSDAGVYPPMSDVLRDAAIPFEEGWDDAWLQPRPDLVVMGNAGLPRGHAAVEAVLNAGIPFVSGAEFIGTHLLPARHVFAVAGTHGKTTTTAMLAWVLHACGADPGYLVGGVPANFTDSARLGGGTPFVIEADEYDCSYFDRRSKFVHYHPRTLIMTNLEFDHADIFDDLGAIQTQFHNLLRCVPATGRIVAPVHDQAIEEVLERGCWTPIDRFADTGPGVADGRRPRAHELDSGQLWTPGSTSADGRTFEVVRSGEILGEVKWPLLGSHNQRNALATIAAAEHLGIAPEAAIEALGDFRGVKRRMERIWHSDLASVYDDFAHHPTAIRTTLQGLRDAVGSDEILAVVEPRTHTMSLGSLRDDLRTCCAPADEAIWFRTPQLTWDLSEVTSESVVPASIATDVERLVETLAQRIHTTRRRLHILIMSNGSFGGIYSKLTERLESLAAEDGEKG